MLSTAVAAMASTTDHGHRLETELRHVHLELVRRRIRRVRVELEGLPVDPSLDARGSERSLQIALADPAEGSDDVADDLDDCALVQSSRHYRCEAARTRFDWLLAVPVRALPLYAKCGDSYGPRA